MKYHSRYLSQVPLETVLFPIHIQALPSWLKKLGCASFSQPTFQCLDIWGNLLPCVWCITSEHEETNSTIFDSNRGEQRSWQGKGGAKGKFCFTSGCHFPFVIIWTRLPVRCHDQLSSFVWHNLLNISSKTSWPLPLMVGMIEVCQKVTQNFQNFGRKVFYDDANLKLRHFHRLNAYCVNHFKICWKTAGELWVRQKILPTLKSVANINEHGKFEGCSGTCLFLLVKLAVWENI